jgi:transposase-like protein
MPNQNKRYTPEFRQSSAQLAVDENQPISKTADELGVHEKTLHGWVKKYHPNHKRCSQTHNEGR